MANEEAERAEQPSREAADGATGAGGVDGARPRFSAVLPTYQRAHLIAAAIESALAQRYPADEILVVDDGSTDDTEAVVRAFGPPVRYLRQENAGAAAARTTGARAAACDWVAFLDSDDAWTPGHLERLAAAIDATDGAARFYFADLERDASSGARRQWELAGFEIEGAHELALDATAWMMLSRQPAMLQASAFDRTALLAAGGLAPNLRVREDTHLFLALGLGAPACAVAGVGARMSDEGGDARLTAQVASRSLAYLDCSVWLYRDILRRELSVSPVVRAELSERLANARITRAARRWERRRLLPALADLGSALVRHPRQLLRRLVGRRSVRS